MEEGGGLWRSWWGSGGAEGVRREPVVAVVFAVPVLLQALVWLLVVVVEGLLGGLFDPVVVVVATGGRCRPIESIVKRFHRLPPSLSADVNGTTSPPVLPVVPSPAPSPCPGAVPVPTPAIDSSIISCSTKACGDGCCGNVNTAEVR